MSTREREPEQSGLLKYAPERALASAPELAPSSDRPGEPRSGGARPPERRPPPVPRTREPAPPRKVSKQKGSLEGDVAIEGVCERITRAPDLPPAPPMGDDGGWVFGIIGRLAGCVAMAAVAAYGFVRISAPRQPADNGFAHAGYAPATDAQPDTEPALDRARIHAARPADGSFRPAALRFSPLPAAGVEADTLRPRNEPTPLNRPLLLAAVPSPTLDPSSQSRGRVPRRSDQRHRGAFDFARPCESQRHCSAFGCPRPRFRPLREYRLHRGPPWGKLHSPRARPQLSRQETW